MVVEHLAERITGVLGGFKWSLQRLDSVGRDPGGGADESGSVAPNGSDSLGTTRATATQGDGVPTGERAAPAHDVADGRPWPAPEVGVDPPSDDAATRAA